MKKIITAAAFAVIATSASAQVSNFAGFSAGVNLNSVSPNTKITVDTVSVDGVGQQSWNGAVQGAYGFVTSPSTVISIGATYGLGKSKGGSIAIAGVGGGAFEAKNQLSVYVEPGFLINDKTLVYGKLSYEKAKVEANGEGGQASKSINGTGFGFGARTMIDKTTYLQVEFKQIGYGSARLDGDTADFKTKATVGTVGIGMNF